MVRACGAEVISNRMINHCMYGICTPLTCLINTSLSLGQSLYLWKLANVLPLFKSVSRQLKSNYRPVSPLSCMSKICERIVFRKLYLFLESTGFSYCFQSGFRLGDSTVMQLVYIVHIIHEALDRGNEVRAIFLDISKALDKVWHPDLLAKLKADLGIEGALLKWFVSYLSCRKQRVALVRLR